MSNIIEVLVDEDKLSVVGPPEYIKVSIDSGRDGRRGSLWFSGNGIPSAITIPYYDRLQEYDMYIDSSVGQVYQYIMMPNNILDWNKTFKVPVV